MKIYHYSSEPRFSIKTKRMSGMATKEEIEKAERQAKRHDYIGAYVDHISFFCGRIPASLLPRLYGQDHQAWRNGNHLYEHVIDTATLDKDVAFTLVESRNEKLEFDKFSEKNNWTGDDPELLAKWFKHLAQCRKKWGEEGSSLKLLDKQVGLYEKTLKRDFLAAAADPDFEYGRMKYAANVPHLMVYPSSGVVVPEKIYSLTMGQDARQEIIIG